MAYYNIESNHACSKLPMGFYRPPSQHEFLNYSPRPENEVIDTIVLHYTVFDYSDSYKALSHSNGGRPGPSVHYMVNIDGRIDNLVDDTHQAWHAGKSAWKGVESVNKRSIGIELINPGSGEQGCFPIDNETKLDKEKCTRNSFSEEQIKSLIDLISCLRVEHTNVTDQNIIGHSDISPGRKLDPGVEFPWEKLYEKNIGVYSNLQIENSEVLYKVGDSSSEILSLRSSLNNFGYNLTNVSDFDLELANVVRAFHLHFNQDVESQDTGWGDWNKLDQLRLSDMLKTLGEISVPTEVHEEL